MSDDYVVTTSTTLASAQRVIAAAVEKAEALSVAVCIAVTDSAGHLLAMVRADRRSGSSGPHLSRHLRRPRPPSGAGVGRSVPGSPQILD